MPVIKAVQEELAPIRERAEEFRNDRKLVQDIISEGCEAARDVARETLDEVRQVMGLNYR
jgi:tryptophanyl-tRNA synthetase